MVLDTVRRAYAEVVESGLLNKQEGEVLLLVASRGSEGATQNEADRHYDTSSHHKRFARLEELGLIKPCGTRVDPQTGKHNTVFVATGVTLPASAPALPQVRLTKKEREEGLDELCRAITFAADHGYPLTEPLERIMGWLFNRIPASPSDDSL